MCKSSDTAQHEGGLTRTSSDTELTELFHKCMEPSNKQLVEDSNDAHCSQQPETQKQVRLIALQHQPSNNRNQQGKRRSIIRVLARRRNADIEEVHM